MEAKYMREWGTQFSPLMDTNGTVIEHKKLTITEALLYTNMMNSDYLSQLAITQSEILIRLQRIEIWISERDPSYGAVVRKALSDVERNNGSS